MSNNPYQPPSQFSEQPLSGQSFAAGPQKPTAATVFGILNLLFGGLGLCGIVMTAAFMFVPLNPQMKKDNPALQLMEESAVYRTFTQVAVVLGFFATIVLIVAGIGLLTHRPYGRTLSIGYGIYAVVTNVLGTIINVVYVFPALLEKANAAGGGPAAAGAYGGIIGGLFGTCLGLIYPVVLLYFMFRPNMVAAFKK
jgi:hypothetical protein